MLLLAGVERGAEESEMDEVIAAVIVVRGRERRRGAATARVAAAAGIAASSTAVRVLEALSEGRMRECGGHAIRYDADDRLPRA
jgi:hypothetical protein